MTTQPTGSGSSWLILVMLGFGVFAFVYLVLLARAVTLDERAIQLDRQIAHARGQRVLAEQHLRSTLTLDALGIDLADLPLADTAEASLHVPTPPLPPLEPCPVLMIADAEAMEEIASPAQAGGKPADKPTAVIASASPPG